MSVSEPVGMAFDRLSRSAASHDGVADVCSNVFRAFDVGDRGNRVRPDRQSFDTDQPVRVLCGRTEARSALAVSGPRVAVTRLAPAGCGARAWLPVLLCGFGAVSQHVQGEWLIAAAKRDCRE